MMKRMPDDTSCRVEQGGCGRPITVVREPVNRRPFGGVLRSNNNSRMVAIHEDDFDEKLHQRVQFNGAQFIRLRPACEQKCVAHHEQLRDNAKEGTLARNKSRAAHAS